MWKVTNKTNNPYLTSYDTLVITPFWDFLVEITGDRAIKAKIDQPDVLETYVNDHASFDIRLLKLKKKGKTSFRALTVKIIQQGRRVVNKEYKAYKMQNELVDNLDYNFNKQAHPQAFTDIFKIYFYEKGWETAWIWKDVVKLKFNRTIFQENFKIENKLSICPYCDLTTIPSARSAWVEHFLPKEQFPYVANNPHNVLPTCTPCNVSGTGKGTATINPVTNPYREQIGDLLEFRIVAGDIEIQPTGNIEVENYLSVLKSRTRYQEANVKRSVFSTLISTYNFISKAYKEEEEMEVEFQSFIEEIGREQGHYFARKTLIKDINTIVASIV